MCIIILYRHIHWYTNSIFLCYRDMTGMLHMFRAVRIHRIANDGGIIGCLLQALHTSIQKTFFFLILVSPKSEWGFEATVTGTQMCAILLPQLCNATAKGSSKVPGLFRFSETCIFMSPVLGPRDWKPTGSLLGIMILCYWNMGPLKPCDRHCNKNCVFTYGLLSSSRSESQSS